MASFALVVVVVVVAAAAFDVFVVVLVVVVDDVVDDVVVRGLSNNRCSISNANCGAACANDYEIYIKSQIYVIANESIVIYSFINAALVGVGCGRC